MSSLSRIFSLILIIGFCFINNAEARTISSIVLDIETGEVLLEDNADELRYPASLTKMMTLYIAFTAIENGSIGIDDELTVSRTAANRSPSRLGLKPGSKIKVEDAIKALIVKSANDCATVLAEGIGKDEAKFAEAMTTVAQELGMKNTTFKNASGLPNRKQKTTAKDMAVLAAALHNHFPQYYELFSLRTFTYNGLTHKTHNTALKKFEESDGLKTGFTAAAGYNIATSAQRDGKRVIAVTMGHDTQNNRDKKVIAMMDKSLNELAGIKDKETMLAEIILTPKPDYEQVMLAQSSKLEETVIADNAAIEEENINTALWDVKIGSFSNYAKAKNYAKSIQKQNLKNAADKKIEVEIEEVNAALVYNPKIVGFSKEDANNFCNGLKKSNKSCMVTASKQLYLAYQNNE
ncbi:MAG: D-alanyl-D-alanine carboxypeptidase [Lactobacillaceae bacterium]|jgi:D-alanyl-D-alanine carboxypeptidase|nr:D-alanyl-D-alanine carboxypeptidase [Lactobacillaceae bacterium]